MWSPRAIVIGVGLIVPAVALPAHAAPGEFDPSFSDDGRAEEGHADEHNRSQSKGSRESKRSRGPVVHDHLPSAREPVSGPRERTVTKGSGAGQAAYLRLRNASCGSRGWAAGAGWVAPRCECSGRMAKADVRLEALLLRESD